ncbi:MAG: hypothetical protein GXP15_12210 [Gammaproteobacteria bacterium]|nr:hypothetical protein [Gammaproteobacteria bacterium]
MNLRRQLLLVSLLTLVLPWAGCQFIRETESALREGQQRMLSGTAQAIADSLSQFPAEFLAAGTDGVFRESQIYGYPLGSAPLIDGYIDDWSLPPGSVRSMRGIDGAIRFALGTYSRYVYVFVETRDTAVIYATPSFDAAGYFSDNVSLTSVDRAGTHTQFKFIPEAPGAFVARRIVADRSSEEGRVRAYWRNTPNGYRLEARIPLELLGERIGLAIQNTRSTDSPGVRSASFDGSVPGRFIAESTVLSSALAGYAQPDLRLIVTDPAGWRLAQAGQLITEPGAGGSDRQESAWLRRVYNALLESGKEAALAEPDPSGREQQEYVRSALRDTAATAWFRSPQTGRAVVTVAQPIWSGTVQTGTLILQQGTDAILSLTNQSLGRLINFTLIATLAVAFVLIGYANWLSMRIRRLSTAAENALDDDRMRLALPSALAGDEVGDLSRSFSTVLRQLGNYNEYLRTLASKLSHELRTPLTIVSSSLENLEHESLSNEARQYTARARDGAARLKKILSAMSEASRVEELMQHADPETFDLRQVLQAATAAYADIGSGHRFRFDAQIDKAVLTGSPEMIMQLLDKLIDNAIGFSKLQDEIVISLDGDDEHYRISIENAGPPLPESMRLQLFDSMVSVRPDNAASEHLGLGLYIAKLIAEGHGGTIQARNIEGGVVFCVQLPVTQES